MPGIVKIGLFVMRTALFVYFEYFDDSNGERNVSAGVCCLVMYNRMKRHVRSASYFTTDPET